MFFPVEMSRSTKVRAFLFWTVTSIRCVRLVRFKTALNVARSAGVSGRTMLVSRACGAGQNKQRFDVKARQIARLHVVLRAMRHIPSVCEGLSR